MSKAVSVMNRVIVGVLGVCAIVMGQGAVSATERPAAGTTDNPIPGVVEPYCKDEGQISLNRCARQWADLTQDMYTHVQNNLLLSLSPEQQTQLAAIDSVWAEFQNAHCLMVAEEVEGGSLYPMVLNRCLAQLNNERIAAMQGWGSVPADPDATERNLQTMYLDLETVGEGQNPFLEVAQVHWETYRTSQCQLENELRPDTGADCLALLAAERTAQLRALVMRRR